MPNAAAHFDDDFGLTEPARKKPARRAASKGPSGKKKGKGKAKRFGFNLNMNSVARYAAIGMSAAVVFGILVNALMMQKGHHPAPLFGTSIALGPATKPASKPAEKAAAAPAPTPSVAAAEPAPAPVAKPRPAKADANSEPDAIARLLAGGGVPAATSDKAEAKTVLGAQRALARLGFTVKATGTFGPQTKKAIEAFEKDRHLAVKGELSRRVVKILAAESGIKIEH